LKLTVRADASRQTGSGHIMRCLALAERVIGKRGGDVHFICQPLPGHLKQVVEQRGFTCSLLPPRQADTNGSRDTTVMADQVIDRANDQAIDQAIDQAWDAEQTARLTAAADWLLVDHYQINRSWQQHMRGHCRQLMVIDDLANRAHDCDLLLDQTLGRTAAEYRPWVGNHCTLLTGPDYALLRPDFAAHRDAALLRRHRCRTVRSLLISMGGADADNRTRLVLGILATTTAARSLHITVVIGAQYAHDAQALSAYGKHFAQIEIRRNVNVMAELMLKSDLAIGAAGTTSWERCCLGLPTLTCITADNQREVAARLEATGAIQLWSTGEELRDALYRSLVPATYQRMVDAAATVCDGLGTDRVCSAMTAC